MATVQDVKDAVVAEAAEVKTRVDALEARIAELEASGATPEQLAELKTMVQGIFTAPAP
jgi:BMFP domain-containing protein YqiC